MTGGDRARRGWIAGALLVWGLVLVLSGACGAGSPAARYEKAQQALEAGRHAAARELLAPIEPKNRAIWQALAASCRGQLDAAETCLDLMAPAAHSTDGGLALLAARTAVSLDQVVRAIEWLDGARRTVEDDRELVIEQAKLMSRIGDHEAAVELLEPLVSGDPRVLNLIGYAELLRGRSEAGAAYLERSAAEARELGRAYAPAHYHLGLHHLSQGRLQPAQRELRAAVRANREHLEAHYQWIGVAERLGSGAERAREGFARLNDRRLEEAGALETEEATGLPENLSRNARLEVRQQVDEPRFERTFPAGARLEIACLAPKGAEARFRVRVIGETGAGETLLDVVHASSDPRSGEWFVHEIDLPAGAGDADRVSVELEVLSSSTLSRWLGGEPPQGARFAEPAPLGDPGARSSDPRPNLLVICLDTMRGDRVGAQGYPRNTTPAIDRLAREGVRFARAEAANTWTLPSHYSIFSGLTPLAHGVLPKLEDVRGFLHPDRQVQVRGSEKIEMLAETLAGAGYRTAAVTENGWLSPRFGFGAGFRVYRDDLYGALPRTLAAARRELEVAGERGPWFLFVHTYAPHQPYKAPDEHRLRWADPDHVGLAWPRAHVPISDYNRFKSPLFPPAPSDVAAFEDLYDGQIRWSDEMVANLVGWLEERGLERQTVVVVTSDHGEEIFERGRFDHGQTLYEEVTHVPLVMWAPGRIPAGRVVHGPVSLVDLPATLTDLAGLGERHGDGRSLRPLWESGETSHSGRVAHAQTYDEEGALIGAVWSGPLKYLRREHGEEVKERLFDLAADPGETQDLASARAGEVERMRQLWLEHVERARTTQEALGVAEEGLDRETIDRLKSLGYAQ
jgi:arylsulfatase A-like enzyme/tetratricopeptide (TPR) repeat protein